MKEKKNKGVLKKTLACVICGCMGLAAIAAYFIDADSITNTFTVGSVSLELLEPSWEGKAKDVVPGQEVAKDPQIKNDGFNDEYVFMSVSIPYASGEEETNTQLFTMMNSENEDGINADWNLMGYLDNDENVSAEPVYREDGTVVSLFAYGTSGGMTVLTANQTTDPLFNKVCFAKNVDENEITEYSYDVVVNAYGIQATYFGEDAGSEKTAPTDVWSEVSDALKDFQEDENGGSSAVEPTTKPESTPTSAPSSDPTSNPGTTPNLGNLVHGDGDPYLNIYTAADPASIGTLEYGDYGYTYLASAKGWIVYVLDKTKAEYGPILESIAGKPITSLNGTYSDCANLAKAPIIPATVTDMTNAFTNCTSLVVAPLIPEGVKIMHNTFAGCKHLEDVFVIPASVTDMRGTFKDCTVLIAAITINANPSSFTECFNGVDFEKQKVALIGESTKLDALGATGKNYCNDCDGVCLNPFVIPVNGLYFTTTGETYGAGDTIPTPKTGDRYVYTDYEYCYNMTYTSTSWITREDQMGWGVRVVNKTKVEYAPILESIGGTPIVSVDFLFYECKALIEAPVIPESVTTMLSTFNDCKALRTVQAIPKGVTTIENVFYNCKSLTGTIIINTNAKVYSNCFYGVDFKSQKLTLSGASTMLDNMGKSGNGSYCANCNGYCVE